MPITTAVNNNLTPEKSEIISFSYYSPSIQHFHFYWNQVIKHFIHCKGKSTVLYIKEHNKNTHRLQVLNINLIIMFKSD